MDETDLIIESQPDPRDVAWLEARITESTAALTGAHDLAELAVFVRDDSGEPHAGIYGWTWGGCCELQHLWVEEPHRGHGLASTLLRAAEAEAARRGCSQIVLFTHASQTPGLYERRGYTVVGRVDDYPAGDAAVWYQKLLP